MDMARPKGDTMNELVTIKGIEGYLDKDGVPQINLEHVARGLGFTRIATSGNEVIRWERVEKYLNDVGVPTSGHGGAGARPQYIPEPIFYLLCMKAENETARAFQRTVAYDVLPAIRKHGMYAVDELLENPDIAIQAFTALKEEREKRKALESKVEQDKPKVLFADAVAASHAPMLIGELAKIIKQNGVNTGEKRLFTWMRDNGYLIKRKGTDYNAPTQRSMEQGLFEVKETAITHSDGHVTINRTTKVTGKGQQYFIDKFLRGVL